MENTMTVLEEKDLDNAIEATKALKEYAEFTKNDLEASGLKLDYSKHWAWNSEIQALEYASVTKKKRKTRALKPKMVKEAYKKFVVEIVKDLAKVIENDNEISENFDIWNYVLDLNLKAKGLLTPKDLGVK